jgi:hypothetical protein
MQSTNGHHVERTSSFVNWCLGRPRPRRDKTPANDCGHSFYRPVIALLISLFIITPAFANPEPDIPVRSHFNKDSSCIITVEVDPRCFTDDPMHERYLMKVDLTYRSAADLQKLKDQAADAIQRWVRFELMPASTLKPEFTFTGQNQSPLAKADDPVVITASWKFQRPAGLIGWRVHATKEARYSIVVLNYLDGIEQPRSATLFPGETSFTLDLSTPK